MPPVKPEARVAAIYEITRTSRIYAAPTEFSPRIGDIEPGMKVSVVNGRDGWLEVHSKHGRGRRVSFAGMLPRCRRRELISQRELPHLHRSLDPAFVFLQKNLSTTQ